MDIIYTNANRVEQGILSNCKADIDIGTDNTFSVETSIKNSILEADSLWYVEGTEYGGIVDSRKVDSAKARIYLYGRCFRGILASKVIEPPSGSDYKIVSGECNAVLSELITYLDLGDLFQASSEDSGFSVSDYQFYRYTDAYSGIMKMLKSVGAKLLLRYENGKVILRAVPIVDYSDEYEFDSGNVTFVIKQVSNIVNHVIGLGKGELSLRQVVHRYLDQDGNVSSTKYYTGSNEISTVYENANVESIDELIESVVEELESYNKADEMQMKITDIDIDLGDIVAGRELITKITMTESITRKIIKIENGEKTINYEVGGE